MEVLQFYIVLFFILLIAVIWLRRQGRKDSQFTRSLYYLLVLQLVGVVITTLANPFVPSLWVALGLQVVAWGILLWGVGLDWRASVLFLIAAVTAVFFSSSGLQAMLTWGFVMAVPFATLADLRMRTSFPIFATTPMAQNLRPVASDGHISAEMINSEQPILECLTDGVVICSPSGLIYSVNQAATVILGLAEVDLTGRPISEILAHFPVVGDANEEKRMRQYEVNGRTIEGQMNLIYSPEGAVQGTVAILRDITTEYQAELARDNFLTTVSHELRTPLTAIKGYVELLQTGSGGELTQPQMMFMGTILRNVEKMVQLINSLIFAASIKGGRMEFKSGHANIPQLIRQIARELKPTAAKKQQTFALDIDSRLHMIDADPIHVAMILEELMANALKYGRDSGQVRVVAVLETEEFVVISVTDDGIGIAEEDQAHIFDEFFRPEWREEQVRTGGIGMGLSIVRALVEAYNGRIWFESIPNQGTTFTFILPTNQLGSPETLELPPKKAKT